jgi:hypothetical protein
MGRRTKRAALEVLVSFEPARIAPQCLVQAYERILPVQRRSARPNGREDEYRRATAAKSRGTRRGSEHG